jgi:hypothetical protein
MTITDSQTQRHSRSTSTPRSSRCRADASEQPPSRRRRPPGAARRRHQPAAPPQRSAPRIVPSHLRRGEEQTPKHGSIGWAAAIGLGSNLFGGCPASGAAEIFADPDATNAGMFAPLGQVSADPDGTLRLTGSALHQQLPVASWRVGAFPDTRRIRANPSAPGVSSRNVGHHRADLTSTGWSHRQPPSSSAPRSSSGRTRASSANPRGPTDPLAPPAFTALAPCPLLSSSASPQRPRQLHASAEREDASRVDEPLDVAVLAAMSCAAPPPARPPRPPGRWPSQAVPRPDPPGPHLLAVHHVVEVSVEVTSTVHRLGGGHAAYNDGHCCERCAMHTARQHMLAPGRPPGPSAGIDAFIPPFVVGTPASDNAEQLSRSPGVSQCRSFYGCRAARLSGLGCCLGVLRSVVWWCGPLGACSASGAADEL